MNSNNIKYVAMDDTDIKFYLPRAKILTYDQLSKVKDIEKLLPHILYYYIQLKALIQGIGVACVGMTRP